MRKRSRVPIRPQTVRTWSIRAKIIAVFLVPLVTLIGMWALASAVTLEPGLNLLDAQNNLENIGRPAQAVVVELQAERKLSFGYVAAGRNDSRALAAQRTQTDNAVAAFRPMATSDDARGAATEQTTARLNELLLYLESLPALRSDVDSGSLDRSTTLRRYNQILDSSFGVFTTLVRVSNEDLDRESRALLSMARARELLSQEDAVISGALAAGTFAGTDLGQAIQLIGAQRFLFAETLPDLHGTDRVELEGLAATAAFTSLATLENKVVADGRAGAAPPVDPTAWRAAVDRVSSDLQRLELTGADRLVERSKPAATLVFGRIVGAGLIGLIAVIVTAIASLRVGRSLIRRLAGLRQAALELAIDRLPRVVHRLRHGEDVDVVAEAPPLPYGGDEIGQVGHAFNELQRTAVNAAVEEANVRRGINEVFLNIARRSQTLLHRQLSILDRMERRAEDPTELEDLFRVDHLATRMRRHAEDLVILAGAAPGRGWRNPVPLVDVLRGAVSEVEDYARVSIRPMPDIAVAGRAVGDVIHLLAELIENATSFSPPHTRVNVGGELVSHGLALEIEDRGLGMTPQALAEFNRRLADPPDFDPANSAQLGLFVVARLAGRHGIQVRLRTSSYGGVSAVVLIPATIVGKPGDLARDGGPPALPSGARVGVGSAASLGGRSANGGHPLELPTGAHPVIALPATEVAETPAPAVAQPILIDEAVSGALPRRQAAGPQIPFPAAPVSPDGSAARHARQEVIEATDATGDGLPRRIRQTSMAPQLRDATPEIDLGTQAPSSRTPEELRAMMTSFQTGMVRGRQAAEADETTSGATTTPEAT
jgi:signal transduction histidine kinase